MTQQTGLGLVDELRLAAQTEKRVADGDLVPPNDRAQALLVKLGFVELLKERYGRWVHTCLGSNLYVDDVILSAGWHIFDKIETFEGTNILAFAGTVVRNEARSFRRSKVADLVQPEKKADASVGMIYIDEVIMALDAAELNEEGEDIELELESEPEILEQAEPEKTEPDRAMTQLEHMNTLHGWSMPDHYAKVLAYTWQGIPDSSICEWMRLNSRQLRNLKYNANKLFKEAIELVNRKHLSREALGTTMEKRASR